MEQNRYEKHGFLSNIEHKMTSVHIDKPMEAQLLEIQQTSPYRPMTPNVTNNNNNNKVSKESIVKKSATTPQTTKISDYPHSDHNDQPDSTKARQYLTPTNKFGTPPPPPVPQPQKNCQQSPELNQKFVFKKPIYNHRYQHSHFNHLERHDSLFEELKHLFRRNLRPLSSFRTSTSNEDSSSTSTFGNEFNKDLEQRYGQWGSFLGAGSSGSVRIIRRTMDNKVFAVKEYRRRQPDEPERDYVKKVTAEFCIGSILHNENIIETLDIIQEGEKFYLVMEYAPYDMFTVVMESEFSSEEIGCCWRQLLNGVAYLQSIGLGHRDLKLDNLVMDTHNVVKIIDFGTATVVRYPFQKKEKMCSGVFGSDPYIAPEQYNQKEYSAFSADLWSCGVIFVCMVLRRFAWRVPRPDLDANYRLYLNNKNSLLAYIPRYARPTISKLLEPNPQDRSTLDTLLLDPWVASIPTCSSSTTLHQHNH